MRIFPFFFGCVLLGFSPLLYAAPDARLFENLAGDRRVEVVFDSTGCFHHVIYEFEFQRGENLTAKVMEVTEKWDEAKKPVRTTMRKPLGVVKLTNDEAMGLDRSLAFYRNVKPGGCTTVDRISIKVMAGTKTISTVNYTDATCSSHSIKGLTLFEDVVTKLTSDKKREVEIIPDPKEELAAGMKVARDLKGYATFEKSFKVEDMRMGSINFMPKSLFAQVKALHPGTIDAAWWWNPLEGEKPSLDWKAFMKAFTAADKVMAGHPWLAEWKRLPGKRSLEIHLLGAGIGEDRNELKTYLLPVWKHAGFAGEPRYCLLARHGSHSWFTIYFTDGDERALITSTSSPDANGKSPLDRLDVSWHPKGKPGESFSQYAVIENDGRCQVENFVAKGK